ncbi:hypothetical protein, partial [Acetobacter oeni]|uniref:hypothetical protein n=1 Tax=Acetobacter oeni TaxID=304077 RepID=UPI0022302885
RDQRRDDRRNRYRDRDHKSHGHDVWRGSVKTDSFRGVRAAEARTPWCLRTPDVARSRGQTQYFRNLLIAVSLP